MASATEQMEEYLETIFRLEEEGTAARTGEIARHLHLAPASVTDMLQRLEKAGYVRYEPYKGVQLTAEGRQVGRRQLEKHRIMQAFLQEVCGMPHAEAHEAACDMEHVVPPQLEQWMAEHLRKEHGLDVDTSRRIKDQIG